MFLQGQPTPTDPIIIKIIDPPSEIEGLGEVLLGALGITGAITVAALVCGVLVAGVLFVVRRSRESDRPGPVV